MDEKLESLCISIFPEKKLNIRIFGNDFKAFFSIMFIFDENKYLQIASIANNYNFKLFSGKV